MARRSCGKPKGAGSEPYNSMRCIRLQSIPTLPQRGGAVVDLVESTAPRHRQSLTRLDQRELGTFFKIERLPFCGGPAHLGPTLNVVPLQSIPPIPHHRFDVSYSPRRSLRTLVSSTIHKLRQYSTRCTAFPLTSRRMWKSLWTLLFLSALTEAQISSTSSGAGSRAVRFSNREPGYSSYTIGEILTILILLGFFCGFVGGTIYMAFGDDLTYTYKRVVGWFAPAEEKKERTRTKKK